MEEAKEQKKKVWKPNVDYLRSVTLDAAIRNNKHVDRDQVVEAWEKANK